MALRFFNTLTRKKEVFRPIKPGHAGMYNCGPTVYDFAHIGNFRAYVFADLLRRYLLYKGFRVRQVMNITDVDDKTIKGSRKEGIALKEYTKRYEKAFFEDLDRLNIQRAEIYPRATEHIKEMVTLVRTLLNKGIAYNGNDGIYYDISKFRDYGRFAGLDLKGLKAGARVKQDSYDKERANDFALWKFWDKEDGDVFWETEIGKGRPGWHIECSAMSMKYLGKTFDIHTGGVDLIFPHHQNEIAQSEGATGKRFVRYWLHNEHLLVNGKKMSKSLGNFHTLRDLLERGYDPMAIRYLLLSAHYRQKLDLTFKSLDAAGSSVQKLKEFTGRMKKGKDNENSRKLVKKARKGFEEAMDNDLDMPKALAVLFDFVRDINKTGGGREVFDFMLDIDRVLGLGLGEAEEWKTEKEAEPKLRKMLREREKFRKEKNWKEADRIRDMLGKQGIVLEDTERGVMWKKAKRS